MPWRGPAETGEFATLGYSVADWIEAHCVIPDGDQAGEPFLLPDEQLRFLLWHYRLRPDAKPGPQAFVYRRSQLTRPQKWGKGPFGSAIICAEAQGPVLFDGWDSAGEPVGRPWSTPWIQVVAVSEDQTDNVWRALVPMIQLGDLAADIPDTGRTRINLPDGGLIEPVTSAAVSRLGQRLTFAVHDETHSWTRTNGGVKLADTQRRNLAGMGGRSIETTNAWDPSEGSVAQTTSESAPADVHRDYPDPPVGGIRNRRQRRKVLRAVYAGAPWVDLDRIDAEIEELLPRDPRQAERFFLNRVVAGADKFFDPDAVKANARPDTVIAAGRLVTAGFDGARRFDATGLVVTDVETGHQVTHAVWERPENALEDWEVPEADVDQAVDEIFDTWNVWRLYGDPPYWETALDRWAGRYGDDRVIRWWTNRTKPVAYMLLAYREAMSTTWSHDGHEAFVRHLGNAVSRPTRIRDDDTGGFLAVIGKDSAKSPRKIDLAMAGALSWEARGDALAAGALNPEPTYARASW